MNKRILSAFTTLLFLFNAASPETAIADDSEPRWWPMGSGFSNRVGVITVFDDGSEHGPTLYAGGLLVNSNQNLDRIARFDPVDRTWNRVGSTGSAGVVGSMKVFDDGSGDGPALYVGSVSSSGVRGGVIEKWDGTTWTTLIEGVQPGTPSGTAQMNALAVFDDGSGAGPALYAGGGFTHTPDGEVELNHIGKWNGETLVPLGEGMNGRVRTLAVFDDGDGPALYAGGEFTMAGGVEANRIAKWDGTEWSAVGGGGDGSSNGLNNSVWTMEVFDDGSGSGPALYVGGTFTQAGGVEASRIAKWDGQAWSALGSGANSLVSAMHVFDDGTGDGPALYIGGGFTSAGGLPAHLIARWDGSAWSVVSIPGMNNPIRSFTVFDDGRGGGPSLYAGGWFTSAGGVQVNRIARWGRPPTCPADLNLDGTVNLLDLLRVIDHWGSSNPAGDVNEDGTVNVLDLLEVIASWGAQCE